MAVYKGYSILSIEAKDLFSAMNLERGSEKGYNIRDGEGKVSLRKFENSLDWSLDSIKLKDAYEKEMRRKDFYFVAGGKKYTQAVINVKFTYSYKAFNKVGKNTFIRAGHSFKDCNIEDGACVEDGVLMAIQTNVEIKSPLPQSILGKYFAYANGCYNQTGTIPVLKNKAQLREDLYENGFVCDGIKYVRYKRSAGSSRVGKCLFIMERLAPRMSKWDRCGLNIRKSMPIDLACYEAYISLPMSNIIDTLTIEPENILLVEDYESVFEDSVVAVEEVDNKLVATEKRVEVENKIWDGESLMDVSLFGKYADKGMLLLRNRFFKTCAFNTNIQRWFSEHNITTVEQLNGFTLAKDVSQIKLITTPSSVKYSKFGTFEQWLENIEPTFGIVKYEKETHFFDGRMVQCHYQLLNTLQLSYGDVERLAKPSLDYINAIRTDPAVLRYHIGYAYEQSEDDETDAPCKTKSDIVFKLLGVNNRFAQTKIYKDFRGAIVKGFFRNLKRGHILLNGNYSTLLGNGIELLQQAIGCFHGKSVLKNDSIHTKRFAYGTEVLGTRSPHVTMGNVLLAHNEANDEIDRYFNMTKEIVYINSIDNNILNRLSGADMDSDTVLLTDNELLISAAKKNYDVYKVPTNCVKSQKTKRHYTFADKADLDIKTSVNKIGEIVNLSQQLNSLYWDGINKGKKKEKLRELYDDICKLDVLSGIEIDKAKREFTIDSEKEIDTLKRKYKVSEDGKIMKPMFFKMITQENGYQLSPDISYKYFETPMDYLQKVIASASYKQSRECKKDTIPFSEVLKPPETGIRSGYYCKLRDELMNRIRECRAQIKAIYIDYELKDKDAKRCARNSAKLYKQECVKAIEAMSSHKYLMYLVLKELDKKENASLKGLMFEILFGKPDEAFMGMIKESREPIECITEDCCGHEKYYDFLFRRSKIS